MLEITIQDPNSIDILAIHNDLANQTKEQLLLAQQTNDYNKLSKLTTKQQFYEYSREARPILLEAKSKGLLVSKEDRLEYIEILERHCQVNLSINNQRCSKCRATLPDNINDDNEVVCKRCYNTVPVVFKGQSNENSIKNIVNAQNGFAEKLKHFGGNDPPENIPNNFEELVDERLISLGYRPCKFIRKLPLCNGKRGSVNYQLMYDILRYYRLNKLYKHVNYVCYILWGWPLKQVDHIEHQCLELFDSVVEPYFRKELNKYDCRLNLNYILLRIIELHKEYLDFDIDPSTFQLPKDSSTINTQDHIFFKLCREQGWPEPRPII